MRRVRDAQRGQARIELLQGQLEASKCASFFVDSPALTGPEPTAHPSVAHERGLVAAGDHRASDFDLWRRNRHSTNEFDY